ncbi:TPA: hypothetical protein HA238_05090, partial [Candidatus Micrarchaeota archaeon]|nr:hypothetical protein [Candidatus Micrarchaeota archaeon]
MKSKSKMLARKNSDKTITCLACARYCRIPNEQAGFCGVKVNDGGRLKLSVYGRPCAVWIDPIEKKPLFHFLPGSKSYSIGTFGCDFLCEFCHAPDSAIINDDSIKTLGELFEECEEKATLANGEVGFTQNRKTITAFGCKKRIKKVFRHFYEGDMLTVHPRHAPSVTCTPEHSFFVYRDADMKKIMAKDLKYNDFLFIPKFKPGNGDNQLDSRQILEKNVSKIKKIRKPGEAKLRLLLKLKEEGKTSRELGKILKTHPSYLRRLSCELKRKGINEKTFYYDNVVVEENGRIKFKMEKGNGIPEKIDVNEDLAELLGYYCAEGNTRRYSTRPSSFNIVFSYGKHETNLIKRTDKLLRKLFGVAPTILLRRTTTTVEVNKSSLGVLLTALCGHKAKEKKIPSLIARSSDKVIAAFLKAFVAGDGCILKDKIAINTVSKKLALGLYHLFLLSDYLPSFYEWMPPRKKIIEGRVVNQSTLYYVKLQAEKFRERFLGNNGYKLRRKSEENLRFKETKDYWLVPVFKVEKKSYSGYVYNCEVEDEHSYLANFVGVANCQNWDISQ